LVGGLLGGLAQYPRLNRQGVLIREALHRLGDQLRLELLDPALFQRRQRLGQPFGQRERESEPALRGPVGDVQLGGDFEVGELITFSRCGVCRQLFQLDSLEVTDHGVREPRIPQEVLGCGKHIFLDQDHI